MIRRIIVGVVLLGAIGAAAWWYLHRRPASDVITLTGNVELRQVTLAFHGNQRIEQVLVEEGAHVRKGQVLARLETGRRRSSTIEFARTGRGCLAIGDADVSCA